MSREVREEQFDQKRTHAAMKYGIIHNMEKITRTAVVTALAIADAFAAPLRSDAAVLGSSDQMQSGVDSVARA